MIATRSHARGLAAIAAVTRATHAGHDCVSLGPLVCESISQTLGFDRVALMRSSGGGSIELLATCGQRSQELPDLIEAAAGRLSRLARGHGPHLLARDAPSKTVGVRIAEREGMGVAVAVPLFSGRRCVGLLAADHGGAAFALQASQRDVLTTLGAVVAAFLDKAIVHDGLVNTLRLKREFIALASHELRTPAAAVGGSAVTLHARLHSLTLEQQDQLLEMLHEQSERLTGLIDQLLDLSRLEAAAIRITPVALAVRDRIEEIVRGVAAGRAGEIDIQVDPSLRAAADREAFDRIVSNLIVNAFRYGRPPITVSAVANDRHFRLAVEDRGPGVAKKFTPHLFERFTRAEDSTKLGAGLGLSIAQGYAHAHGGQLAYEGVKPHGARFELVLPASSATLDCSSS